MTPGAMSAEARAATRWALPTFVLVTAIVAGVYGRTLDAPFIFDDRPTVVENPSIRRLWPPVGDALHRGPLWPPYTASTSRRPLANLTLAIDYAIGGLEPAGYRMVNIALHALTATVLAALVRWTLVLPYFDGPVRRAAGPLAMAVALVWAVHPLVTETVVYVTQRTEILGAFFYLATLWAAVRHWAAPRPGSYAGWVWLGVAALACLSGILSKEIVASAPLAVLLYERTFLVGSWREVRRSWPLHVALMLTWIALALTLLSLRGTSGYADARHRVAPLIWWITQTKVVLLYLKLAVWPWPLTIHYAPIYLRTAADAAPWLIAAAAVATAATVLVRKRPAARFVVVVALLALGPTLIVPLVKMVAAERRMYLPLAGLVALAVVGGYRAVAAARSRERSWIAGAVAAVAVTVLALVSVRRLGAYESAITIWADAVAQQPADPMAHYNLGVALVEAERSPEEAMAQFEEALRLDPDHAGALDNLGMALLRLHRYEEARRRFEQALALDPDDAVAHNNLGALLLELDRPAEALPHLERALAAEPELPKVTVHANLGKALVEVGRVDEGLAHLDEAVRLQPDDFEALHIRGSTLLALGRPADAIGPLEAALGRRPADASTENNLATALLQAGRVEDAIARLERIVAAHPENVAARNNLGTALRALGRTTEAMEQFTRVLGRDAENVTAHFNLGSTLLESDRPAEAAAHFEAVLRRSPHDPQARFKCAIAYVESARRAEGVAMAEAALADADARSDGTLAAAIATWLSAHRTSPAQR